MPVPDGRALHREGTPDRRIDLALIFVFEEIARAGDTLFQFDTAIVNQRQDQPIGVGVGFHLDDAPQQQLVTIPDQMVGAWHEHARHRLLAGGRCT